MTEPAANTPESDAIRLSFAEAYDQLKTITDRLAHDNVPVDELLELLRRGKGLEAALRTRLEDLEQQVTAIESGADIPTYEITP